jgi:intracellular multiplication protein IcmE
MASKKENIKSLFSNTRTRVIIIFTILLLVIAVTIGFIKLRNVGSVSLSSTVSTVPGSLQSIPGVLDPTEQYAQLQEQQNVDQATQAENTGGSAIPTIIRTQALGQGVGVIGSTNGQAGVGFSALAREDEAGAQRSLWIQALQNGSCSKTVIEQVMSQGAQLSDLRAACTCVQLKDTGTSLQNLEQVCQCKELKAAGYNARQLKDIGYSAGQLRTCGFDACELRNAGFTAQEMKDGGYSDGELKGAGFSDDEISRASGLPDGITAADVRNAGCGEAALTKLRKAGVTASAIRRISGCTAEQLKAAGYTAKELKDAGFSAADLKRAGFTAAQLRDAGFTARDLLNAGYTPEDLANAGYSAAQIKAAEAEFPAGISAADIKNAGCGVEELKKERAAGVSATLIKQYAGCSAQALKAAGFTDADLANAGFTPQEISAAMPLTDDAIKAAGCDPTQLRKLFLAGVSAKKIKDLNGCSAEALKAAGYDAKSLLDAGFTPAQLLAAGFTPEEINAANYPSDEEIRAAGCDPTQLKKLFTEGVSAKRIRDINGCSAQALKDAGYDAKSLLDAGFTPAQLIAAGFTPQQISSANPLSDDAIRAAGCDPTQLKKLFMAGVSAKRIKDLNGCSAEALKEAGYSARALLDAGFTPAQLLAAGFTPKQLEEAGVDPAALLAAGRTADCSVDYLKKARAAGISALTIKQTLGCSAQALKAAGYTAKELKDAGFTAAELKAAGFTAAELKAAGFTAKELRDAGFSAQELKDAGFSARDLKDAGFSAAELRAAGFTAAQLKAAGFSAKELKDAGFTAAELKAAGFNAKELKDAGFTAAELKNAGFSSSDLVAAGFDPQDSSVAGLSDPNLSQDTSSLNALPSIPGTNQSSASQAASSNTQLQAILNKQNEQLAVQKYQQKIQQRTSEMLSTANQAIQGWKQVSGQVYTAGTAAEKTGDATGGANGSGAPAGAQANSISSTTATKALIKTGDIVFAVMDTSVNSDEPGPILATIVSGKLKGTKLIGSFTLPSTANKMVITFNTMSVPGAAKTTSISAYAIDPNTARTALSSRTDHHYLMRYGSLFASSFIEGFGNAFQSANTTVTIGGTGGGNNITVQNGIGRSSLQNAVIGLATVGKSWGQAAQQLFSTPVTVEVYSGTGIGILFTQDVTTI